MRYYEIELNDKTIKLRLKSEDIIAIEDLTKKPLLDLIRHCNSVTNIITLLRYMRKSSEPNFSRNNAFEFYDELIDNEYSMEDIVFKIIYPTLEKSGVISLGELNEVMKLQQESNKDTQA